MPLLSVENLSIEFPTRTGKVEAVRGTSFTVDRGETVCLVGESGSGKSVTARAILQIVDQPGRITSGAIRFDAGGRSIDIARLDPRGDEIRALRGGAIAMIFQEPMSSLSPVHRIGDQIAEALILHEGIDKRRARARAVELLEQVEIPDAAAAARRYPFEYSGGMRQRAMIAMALACKPALLIADEPTTALDVTTQAEILRLMARLQRENGMGILFITHDMGIVAEIADRVVVMKNGDLVEEGPVQSIFRAPAHAYTRRLIASVTRLEAETAARPAVPSREDPILRVRDLSIVFGQARKGWFTPARGLRAVDGVSFDLHRGESLGIVGESGSGKTTMGRALLKAYTPSEGRIEYHDGREMVDIAQLEGEALKRARRDIRMVFQDPYASLNPRMTVFDIVAEPLRIHGQTDRKVLRAKVADLLDRVGLTSAMMERYPHAFSGGQRQRIGIARALALDPRIIVADEATSALDVSIRMQILELLTELRQQLDLSFVFISHDIAVVRYFCDRVGVMYRGKLVELDAAEVVCTRPNHAYTKKLISAVPHPDPSRRQLLAG
jgi:peptide/nickel transport system ATP-binding protein